MAERIFFEKNIMWETSRIRSERPWVWSLNYERRSCQSCDGGGRTCWPAVTFRFSLLVLVMRWYGVHPGRVVGWWCAGAGGSQNTYGHLLLPGDLKRDRCVYLTILAIIFTFYI
jgi:hypothetical protein